MINKTLLVLILHTIIGIIPIYCQKNVDLISFIEAAKDLEKKTQVPIILPAYLGTEDEI